MINNDKELLNIICYINSKRNKHNNCFRLKKKQYIIYILKTKRYTITYIIDTIII